MGRGLCTSGGTARQVVFFFFSNRAGCLGSIVISLIATFLLLAFFGVL